MKIHEIFYLIGIMLIIASVAYFYISTSTLNMEPDGTVDNLVNEKCLVDSTLVLADATEGIYQQGISEKKKILYVTIPLGTVLLLTGFVLKRKLEGKDLFIDDDDEDFWE